jgi:hypothetical protein
VKALLAMPSSPGGVATPDFLKLNSCRTAADNQEHDTKENALEAA